MYLLACYPAGSWYTEAGVEALQPYVPCSNVEGPEVRSYYNLLVEHYADVCAALPRLAVYGTYLTPEHSRGLAQDVDVAASLRWPQLHAC